MSGCINLVFPHLGRHDFRDDAANNIHNRKGVGISSGLILGEIRRLFSNFPPHFYSSYLRGQGFDSRWDFLFIIIEWLVLSYFCANPWCFLYEGDEKYIK